MRDAPETRPSLLVRLRDANDEQAWSEFLEIYQPLVYRLVRRQGFQDADAIELTQEVLVAVSRAIDRFDPSSDRGTFRGWLYRIARNLMVNLLIQHRRHPQGIGGTDMLRLLEQQPAAGDESALYQHEYRRRLFRWAAERIRHEFQESTWQAFWLTCVAQRPIAEVAAELGLSIGNVYVARSRIMARLRSRIQQSQESEEL
jgi:RNA polymerase sigma factor (sigma-70 family)